MGKIVDMNGNELKQGAKPVVITPEMIKAGNFSELEGMSDVSSTAEPELNLPDNVVHVAYQETGMLYPMFTDLKDKAIKKHIQNHKNLKKGSKATHFGCQDRIEFEGVQIFCILMKDGQYFDARNREWVDFAKRSGMEKYQFQARFASENAKHVEILKDLKRL